MAKSLCLDLAPVRVNTVAPGGVETEMWNHIPEDKRKDSLPFEAPLAFDPKDVFSGPRDVDEVLLPFDFEDWPFPTIFLNQLGIGIGRLHNTASSLGCSVLLVARSNLTGRTARPRKVPSRRPKKQQV